MKLKIVDFSKKSFSEITIRKFIEENKGSLGNFWYYISRYQRLSEEFMDDFKDSIMWYYVSMYQEMSEEFLIRHMDRLDLRSLSYNINILKDVKDRVIAMKELMG